MSKKTKATDPARFEGNGISYRAKLIGSEDVAEARGDKMCQETIQKLKGAVKTSGQHKKRIFVNVTLEGLKIIDGHSLNVLHTHQVHQISFISRDVTDSRAFGYVFGSGDGSHKFYGIKTANSAENVVLALRDLFQTVYEMKKQEMEEAKAKAAGGTDTASEEKDTEKTEGTTEAKPAESAENIEQGIEQIQNLDFDDLTSEEAVGPAPSNTTTTSPVTTAPPVAAPLTDPWGMPAATDTSSTQPAQTAASSSSSALSDLEGLSSGLPPSTNPFGGFQAFSVAPASASAAFFGMGQSGMAQPGMAQPGMAQSGMGQPSMPFGQQGMMGSSVGLPVTNDPFSDPFNTSSAQQQMGAPAGGFGAPAGGFVAPAGGFGAPAGGFGAPAGGFGAPAGGFGAPAGGFGMQSPFSSPFPATVGGPAPAQPFPGAMAAPGMQPAFGTASPSFSPFGAPPAPTAGMGVGVVDPFQPSAADSLLQPSKAGDQEEKRPVSPAQPNLFGDLLNIKKAGGAETAVKTPKEMFQPPPKKSMNQMKGSDEAPQASVVFDQDPFAEDPFGSIDTMLNTIATSDTDPFATPHLPVTSSSSSPPPLPPPSLPHPPPAPPDPSSPTQPDLTLSAASSKESSPESRFDVPNEPPPPLPAHLMLSAAAPSPPPRPPPIPNRPMPKTQKNSPAKCVSRSFSTPPPLPTTPRPSSSIASSSPASELSTSDTAPAGGVEGVKGTQSSREASAQNSPRVFHPRPPPSPSHSWGSSGSLSHSSSQKSLEKAAVVTPVAPDNDDPFGVPLRSKRSFSSADGASKRSSRSSGGKLSVKSDFKMSVAVDPFGVPLKDRTNSSEGTGGGRADGDNPFSVPAFSDSVVASSSSPWEAFGDHPGNGVTDGKKSTVAVAANGQRTNSSPFGDPFFSTPINGKPSGTQS